MDIEYLKFRYDYRTVRDVYYDIFKNYKYTLEKIAEKCELDYKGFTKKQLVELIEKYGCSVLSD